MMKSMLWLLVVSLAAVTCVSGSKDSKLLEIVLPSVLGFVLVVATIAVVVCVAFYCHRRVTSLEYVLSKNGMTSKHSEDEKTSLMPHEVAGVEEKNRTASKRARSSSPQAVESEYSVIRAEHIAYSSTRDSRSRSQTPDASLTAGIRGTLTSYGAVDGGTSTEENQYTYVNVDRKKHGGSRYENISRPRGLTTSIQQSMKHYQSGSYVLSQKDRAQLSDPHYEMQESSTYDRLEFFEFFDTNKEYWPPAKTMPALYEQLSYNRYREISRKDILVLEEVGSGQFGTVCKGLWICEGESMLVAVKSLQENASEGERVKFLQEAALMGQFSHPNIIGIHGVVTISTPTLIVLELATTDLHKYLRGIRSSQQFSDYLPRQLLRFSSEVAAGMQYLSKKCFVHRDLAARNILLDYNLVCKIGDFGMARDLMDEEFYTSTDNRPLPVKWMAPEALLYRTYSTASDVWSYGMVLYEIWSVGLKPYQDLTNKDVIDNLLERQCHPPPAGCPRPIYKLMVGCWYPEAENRLTFSYIQQSLCQPEDYLLSWSEEDISGSPLARQLGADPSHSLHLYIDLQRIYLTNTDSQ